MLKRNLGLKPETLVHFDVAEVVANTLLLDLLLAGRRCLPRT